MANKDLRYFLKLLQDRAPEELVVVKRPVSPVYETCAVLRKLQEERRFPAVLFQNVQGSSLPVVANVLASRSKLALALEVAEKDLTLTYSEREDGRLPCRMVPEGPVQEVVRRGDDIDLAELPIVTHCEKDSGAFITAGITVVKDPDTGIRNCGIYRMMVLGRNLLGMSYEKHTHIGHVHRKMISRGKPLEAVTFIGHHPAFMLGSQSKAPFGVDELEVTGGLLREPVELVKCQTIDLEVPAWAEVAIEGLISPDRVMPEGPFGEYTWYYGLERISPVMEVTAITRRHDAIFQDLFAAHPEHNFTGLLGREAVLYKRVKAVVPAVIDVRMPLSGLCRFHAYVRIRKEYDGEGKMAALAALASDPFVKLAIVVDEDVNIDDDSEVLWAVATRTQPDRSTFFIPECACSRLDPASYSIWSRIEKDSMNTKWGIDATRPVEAPFEERAEVPEEMWRSLDLSSYVEG